MRVTISKTTAFCIAVILTISVVSHWQWFFKNSYFGWGDARLLTRFKESWISYANFPNIWSMYGTGLGEIDLIFSQYPIYMVFGALTQLGFDARLVSKLIFLVPVALIPALGSYLLIRDITRSHLSSIIGSIIYSFNVNALLTQTGSLSISAAYALAPVCFLMFIKALEKKSIRLGLVTGLIFFLQSIYEFRIFYVTAFVLFFYLIFYFVVKKENYSKNLIRTLYHTALPFIFLAFATSYWLFPYLMTGSIQTNPAFSRPLFGDKYASFKQSIAFFSPWWTAGHGYANGVVQPIPVYFWTIPTLALLGFILNTKSQEAYFFLFISVLGILLTKQSDSPFPNLYLWLFQHFPGFNAFRESSKFFLILSIGYSALIAFLVSFFRSYKIISLLIAAGIGALFLWNIKPLITGQIGGLFIPKTRPQDFIVLKDFLHGQKDFFRTAWIPAAGMWGYYSDIHPKIDLHTVYFDILGPMMASSQGHVRAPNKSSLIGDVNHQFFDLFVQSNSNELLDSLNIKYVIVPLEDKANDDDVFVNYGLPDREYLLNFLDGVPYLSRVSAGTSEIVVYENSNFKPLILIGPSPVHYQRLSSSEYVIQLPPTDEASQLVFTDAYHPAWTLTVNDQSYVSEKFQQLFNSFSLPPHAQPVTARLFFTPQKYVVYGSTISLASLLTTLLVLLILSIRARERKI
ncbi:MAG TPA: hypothetical protein DEV73_01555 [Candidatus Zambryskibacteria bacterium]|nr:hypothetical protein [Candidatus Zambryskibacteria bacterium]